MGTAPGRSAAIEARGMGSAGQRRGWSTHLAVRGAASPFCRGRARFGRSCCRQAARRARQDRSRGELRERLLHVQPVFQPRQGGANLRVQGLSTVFRAARGARATQRLARPRGRRGRVAGSGAGRTIIALSQPSAPGSHAWSSRSSMPRQRRG